jgi:hypothetical protein
MPKSRPIAKLPIMIGDDQQKLEKPRRLTSTDKQPDSREPWGRIFQNLVFRSFAIHF